MEQSVEVRGRLRACGTFSTAVNLIDGDLGETGLHTKTNEDSTRSARLTECVDPAVTMRRDKEVAAAGGQ